MAGPPTFATPPGFLGIARHDRDAAFVAKPFTKETLGRKIRAVLDQGVPAEPLAAGSGSR